MSLNNAGLRRLPNNQESFDEGFDKGFFLGLDLGQQKTLKKLECSDRFLLDNSFDHPSHELAKTKSELYSSQSEVDSLKQEKESLLERIQELEYQLEKAYKHPSETIVKI